MKRIPKQVITYFLTLVLMLSLCACAQNGKLGTGSDEAEIGADEDALSGMADKKKPGRPSGETDIPPAQAGFSAEAEQSLAWLRDRIDFPQTMFGAAYLGYVEEGSDWLSAADQAMLEAYPFLAEIDENHIIGRAGHLYRSAIGRKAGNRCCSLPIWTALPTRPTHRSGSPTAAPTPANGGRPSTP